jgi:hypothetical protein
MSCITIISCFSYTGSKKYAFSQKHIRSDVRKILSFSHNQIGCSLDNIYVMTDIKPLKTIQNEILNDFCSEVTEYLTELGLFFGSYHEISIDYLKKIKMSPTQWLSNLCSQLISGKKADNLYKEIMRTILPVIRTCNIIEFASLFANLIIINGKSHFDRILNTIFNKKISNVFFYYTGHGIKLDEICLIIPRNNATAEFYTQKELQARFDHILNNMPSFIVFDCCHGHNLLKLPKDKHIESIYLSSTSHNQTCGFYIPKSGSLFTYYLMQFLNKCCKTSLSGLQQIESQIQEYRKSHKKKPQNISMILSNDNMTHFPSWLFQGMRNQLLEEED